MGYVSLGGVWFTQEQCRVRSGVSVPLGTKAGS